MNVPEVTEDQLKFMTNVCLDTEMGVFSQCDPIPDDPLLDAVIVGKAQQDVEHLVELGFLKNITEDHKEQLEEQNKRTGRTWRVYSVTALGRAMFQLQGSTAKN